MVFRNIILGATLIAATAFAKPADSTTHKDASSVIQQVSSSESQKYVKISSLNKQKKIIKPATTWSKIKDLFE